MNDYRISLIDKTGCPQYDHIEAVSAQEAANLIREDWEGCYIIRISMVVNDWE